ncbi:hypothetical protein H1C71_015504 [Ictidomys tridecemlineatus]|nr:hypothetical protein H1C71_015504 [Ictidomys tridecemlineatus]
MFIKMVNKRNMTLKREMKPGTVVHACNPCISREAEAGGSRVQSQLQQKQGTKQLSETLSLNKIQNKPGDVAQWPSAPEFNPQYPSPHSSKKKKKKEKKESQKNTQSTRRQQKEKGNKEQIEYQKKKINEVDSLNQIKSIIILHISSLNIPIRRQIAGWDRNTRPKHMLLTRNPFQIYSHS